MGRIRDRILLGTISGILAAIPARTLVTAAFGKGLATRRYNPLAAGLFLPRKKIHTDQANLLGLMINNINLAGGGVLMTYLLSATGTDLAALKCMGVGAMSWVAVEGLMGASVLNLKPKNTVGPIVSLGAHLIYGGLCALLITRLGDPALFPPRTKRSGQVPLIYTGRLTRTTNKL